MGFLQLVVSFLDSKVLALLYIVDLADALFHSKHAKHAK
jgi:hypothetical protein